MTWDKVTTDDTGCIFVTAIEIRGYVEFIVRRDGARFIPVFDQVRIGREGAAGKRLVPAAYEGKLKQWKCLGIGRVIMHGSIKGDNAAMLLIRFHPG